MEGCSLSSAYMLIEVEPGSDEWVLGEIRKVKGVYEAHAIFGTYDLIVELENKSAGSRVVSEHVRRIQYIRHTYTMPIIS